MLWRRLSVSLRVRDAMLGCPLLREMMVRRCLAGGLGSVRGVARRLSTTTPNPDPTFEAAKAAAATAHTPYKAVNLGDQPRRVKHKTPRKKASSMLALIQNEELEKAKQRNREKGIPRFQVGDAIQVEVLSHLTTTEPWRWKGVVIAIRRNGIDTWITLIDVVHGVPVRNSIQLYSPFLKSLKILQKAFIHEGKKRVRRSKLYYLWDKRDPREYTITG